jgi:hypothetical protein
MRRPIVGCCCRISRAFRSIRRFSPICASDRVATPPNSPGAPYLALGYRLLRLADKLAASAYQ